MKNILILLVLSFYICQGQTGFQRHIIIDDTYTAQGANNVITADLDGDGDPDIISTSRDDNKLAWYENLNGQDEFGPQQLISDEMDKLESLFAIDIDGDNDIDLLSASSLDDKIAWYENTDGLGNFGPQQIIANNVQNATALFASDLDGDGDIDVLSADYSFKKTIWYENTDGLGDFSTEKIIDNTLAGVTKVQSADLDNDGDQDVLILAQSDKKFVWLENIDGLGTFGPPQEFFLFLDSVVDMITGDLDGDGDEDVVATLYISSGTSHIVWFENTDGQGSFGMLELINGSLVGIQSLHLDDFHGDGDLDVFYTGSNVAWLENTDGQGTFGTPQIISDQLNSAKSIYTADLDGDGDLDALTASNFTAEIAWHKNLDGLGDFEKQTPLTLVTSEAWDVEAGDVDGDGDRDIVACFQNEIVWYENQDGKGDYSSKQIITANNGSLNVFVRDIDGDGDFDVLTSISWFENLDGLGTFGNEYFVNDLYGEIRFATDIDGDDDIDLLTGSSSSDDFVSWHENVDGLGNFGASQLISTGSDLPQSIYAADLDNDGDQDVLVASLFDDKIIWHENTDGLGTFNSAQIISTIAYSARGVFAADLDGDGDLDVLSASSNDGSENRIAWYENTDGQGTYGDQQLLAQNTVWGAKEVYATDLDGDGDFDVVFATEASNQIGWFENLDGLANFGPAQILDDQINGGYALDGSDLNGDGKIDILLASHYDDKIVWYENLGFLGNTITGWVRLDFTGDGCDSIYIEVEDLLVTTTNGANTFSTFTNQEGHFSIPSNSGIFTTTIDSPLEFYDLIPTSFTSNFSGLGSTDTLIFCLQPNQTINDINVSFLPVSESRAGFVASYDLVFENKGTTTLGGNIVLEFDGNVMDFSIATETPSMTSSNTLTFAYSDLQPLESRVIGVAFDLFPPPTLNNGDQLTFKATANPITNDLTPEDNVYLLDQIIIGSYDPNDITVLEGPEILLEEVDNYLHYVIRFQNTGTASAIKVRVRNVLDDNLDWSTLELESSSHANRVEIIDGNVVDFIFDGIYLPDSTSNERESHGYIAYKIKPKGDLTIGDVIPNQVDIFFDFNAPIATNVVKTTIVEIVNVDQVRPPFFSIYPSPTSGSLTVDTENPIAKIEIFDALGLLVYTTKKQKNLDLSGLPSGLYLCKLTDKNGRSALRKFFKTP